MTKRKRERIAIKGLGLDTETILASDDYQELLDFNNQCTEYIEKLKADREAIKDKCTIEFRLSRLHQTHNLTNEINAAGITKIQIQARQSEVKAKRHVELREYIVNFARKLCPNELWEKIMNEAYKEYGEREAIIREEQTKKELEEYEANKKQMQNYMQKLENRRYV